jgi:hypothetical protein
MTPSVGDTNITIFRYAILCFLYAVIFINFYNVSTQFIFTIILFILNFFTIVFLFKDIFSIEQISKNLFSQYLPTDVEYNPITKLFIFAIGITLLLNIASLAIVISVFDYGKKSTNMLASYTMTRKNTETMGYIITMFKRYVYAVFVFAFLVVYTGVSAPVQRMMYNIAGTGLSIALVGLSTYLCIYSVDFLNVRTYRMQLYQ